MLPQITEGSLLGIKNRFGAGEQTDYNSIDVFKEELIQSAAKAFIDPKNKVYISSVSTREIIVKYISGKLPRQLSHLIR